MLRMRGGGYHAGRGACQGKVAFSPVEPRTIFLDLAVLRGFAGDGLAGCDPETTREPGQEPGSGRAPGRGRGSRPSASHLHLTVLPPPTEMQLGFAGAVAVNVASPHCPPEANGTSITIVPVKGRFAVLTT